jgi:hypothetical protein
MRASKKAALEWAPARDASLRTGRIVGVDADGRALVSFEGGDAVLARTLVQFDVATDPVSLPSVALVFEAGDLSRPIIAGWLHDRAVVPPKDLAARQLPTPREAVIDGERLVFKAEKEIQLVCGGSSITLTKDGHIVIKGAHLVSRSSGVNKIKGASVNIN